MKASYKIVKRLFCLNYTSQKYHCSVRNVVMVLVAAVALGSSTYAWFVSNNTVTAKTASISAQSNAPFLKIAKTGETLTETSATQVTGTKDKTELYPSQWNHVVTDGTYQFESAYASKAGEATVLAGSRFAVGGVDAEKRPEYALKQSFDIGTTDAKAGSFQNLKVANVAIDAGANSTGLVDAMCVLVKCGDNWGVYKKSAAVQVTDALVNTIAAGNKTTVDVYVFYDGSAKTVYSDNLANLKNCGVTVTFTATPVNTDGNAVNCANNAVTNTTVQP